MTQGRRQAQLEVDRDVHLKVHLEAKQRRMSAKSMTSTIIRHFFNLDLDAQARIIEQGAEVRSVPEPGNGHALAV